MKTRERKQADLNALAEELNNSKSAMIVSFNKLTVNKDQEFRNQLREAGAKYQVVKNTIARLAVKGTPYENASEHFKGVTAIAWTENDPVVLSKAISKFTKDNADFYTLKAGIVDGKVVDAKQVEAIASLPSKEVLISKLLFVLNAQAQRIVTVINAVPRNLAVVIKQIGDAKSETEPEQKAAEPATEKAEEATPAAEEPKQEETAAPEASAETQEAPAQKAETGDETEEAPAATESETAVTEEATAESATEAEPASETEEATAETAPETAPSAEESAAPETSEEAAPEGEEKSE
ncbi:MAG TPA: 50S ribosomal protein L10 [Pyrinomonadaceae bacterium]|jgi:large subunit ribosomal protein L10